MSTTMQHRTTTTAPASRGARRPLTPGRVALYVVLVFALGRTANKVFGVGSNR